MPVVEKSKRSGWKWLGVCGGGPALLRRALIVRA